MKIAFVSKGVSVKEKAIHLILLFLHVCRNHEHELMLPILQVIDEDKTK